LFVDYEEEKRKDMEDMNASMKEKNFQQAALEIKKKYGKNAILKGISLEDGATAKERNEQIGGHKA
ncbi:MAG TPA: DNA methylase, partial [Candidatus Ornithospirochaeta stercorigallinarum]|nr:DNA methylase [Candidatus Ornithospirochaeta stercorigallinarum]